ncbi:MAG: glycerophosphodiester phosphodiesterase family protein [Eubacteriales bacterium]|nr:glycerophosphodiester phosphodiesterase family protein [Eubacteriales bacterium]
MKSRKKDHKIQTIISVIMQNWSVLICFELFYKVVGLCFIFPFIGSLIGRLPALVNESYLSQENFVKVLLNPAAVLLLAAAILIAGIYLFFEIIALTLYSEMGWKKEEVTVGGLLRMSWKAIGSMFQTRRAAGFLLVIIMPLSFLGLSSSFLRTVQIPEFIWTAITENSLYIILLISVGVIINYLFFLYIVGFPILFLTDSSFGESWKESIRLLKGRKIRTIGSILWNTFVLVLLLCLIWLVSVSGLAGYIRIFDGAGGKQSFLLSYNTFAGMWNLLTGIILSVFLSAMSVVFYHDYKMEKRPQAAKSKWTLKHTVIRIVIAAVAVISLLFLADTEIGTQMFYPNSSRVEVVAHRGGAVFGPENTVAALNNAIKDGADMAEIDVQQLKDGTLVILHDTNFKRTTGVNLNVWDAEYQQVKTMDAGKYFSPEYLGEPVPTLEQMLKAAKGKIDLMIELKATGYEKNLVEDTLALIEKYDMEKQCNIASLDFELLKQVKELKPDIQVTYITVLLVSEQYSLKNIDCYSIETTFLTRELVYQAHAQGKKVYGWTASNDENIKKILNCEADGIVTDNPLLVRYNLDKLGDNTFTEYGRMFVERMFD